MKKTGLKTFAEPILRSRLQGLYSLLVTTKDDDKFLRDSCPAILCVKLYSHLAGLRWQKPLGKTIKLWLIRKNKFRKT